MYLYKDIEEDDKKEIIKLIEEKESESGEIMITARRIINEEIRKRSIEAQREGMQKGIKEGIKEGIKKGKKEGKIEGVLEAIRQTIERMIKMNLEDDFIKQATGAKKSEIEKVRKALGMQQ